MFIEKNTLHTPHCDIKYQMSVKLPVRKALCKFIGNSRLSEESYLQQLALQSACFRV